MGDVRLHPRAGLVRRAEEGGSEGGQRGFRRGRVSGRVPAVGKEGAVDLRRGRVREVPLLPHLHQEAARRGNR